MKTGIPASIPLRSFERSFRATANPLELATKTLHHVESAFPFDWNADRRRSGLPRHVAIGLVR